MQWEEERGDALLRRSALGRLLMAKLLFEQASTKWSVKSEAEKRFIAFKKQREG